jgi:hypothetical protein
MRSRPTVADKRRAFRSLHESGCFLIPNPWDVGSALYLQSLGFKALATTSAGYAWSQGRRERSDRPCAEAHTCWKGNGGTARDDKLEQWSIQHLDGGSCEGDSEDKACA